MIVYDKKAYLMFIQSNRNTISFYDMKHMVIYVIHCMKI